MERKDIINEIEIEFSIVYQHLSNLSALATKVDLSGEQLARFLQTKYEAVNKLAQARSMLMDYLGVIE